MSDANQWATITADNRAHGASGHSAKAAAISEPVRVPVWVWVVIVAVAAAVGASVAFVLVRSGAPTGPRTPMVPSTPPPSASASSAVIRLGVVLPMTGPLAVYGESAWNGLTLAVPKHAMVGGRPVELVLLDHGGDAELAGQRVRDAAADPSIVGLIGCVTSHTTSAAGRVAQQLELPLLSPSATNPGIAEIGHFVSRVCYDDHAQGQSVAELARHLLREKRVPAANWTAAVIIEQDNPYSMFLAEGFCTAWREMGGTFAIERHYTAAQADFGDIAQAVAEAKPAVICIPGYYHHVAQMLVQAGPLWAGVPIVGGDGWDSPELIEMAHDTLRELTGYFTTHFVAEPMAPESREFVTAFEDAFGHKPSAIAALGYDAGHVMLRALDHAVSRSTPGTSPTSARADLARAIRGTRDFPGVTGSITISSTGNAIKPAHFAQCTPDGFRRLR